jgi:hypothetical protein
MRIFGIPNPGLSASALVITLRRRARIRATRSYCPTYRLNPQDLLIRQITRAASRAARISPTISASRAATRRIR